MRASKPPSGAQTYSLHNIDWVRLRAGQSPPHWVEGRAEKWDVGYEGTAFFLDWLEDRYGFGIVSELNLALRDRPWDVKMFKELTGHKVKTLWTLYQEWLGAGKSSIASD